MHHTRRRQFAFALVMCLLFGLLPGKTRAEQTQTAPVADTLGFTGEAYSSSSHENASGWCVMKRFSTDTSEQMYTDILTGTTRGFCSSCISNLTAALS